MKKEFENIIGASLIDDREWDVIHTVYQFHPDIDDVNGKTQIAELWLTDQTNRYSNDIEIMFKLADRIRYLIGNITKTRISQSQMAYWEQELQELQGA